MLERDILGLENNDYPGVLKIYFPKSIYVGMPKRTKRQVVNKGILAEEEPHGPELEQEDQVTWWARLQTPEALEYMNYFVLLNSIIVIGSMGLSHFSQLPEIINTLFTQLLWGSSDDS